MSTTLIHRRRAVSPVIATVILIAVAVALGIAVAFWASGLTSSFSKYEKLGVNVQYSSLSSGKWTINLGGQNTGSSDASITQIQVNGVPITPNPGNGKGTLEWSVVQSGACTPSSTQTTLPIAVPSGQTFCLSFVLPDDAGSTSQTFASGQTIQVTIITAAGNNYPASIVLQ